MNYRRMFAMHVDDEDKNSTTKRRRVWGNTDLSYPAVSFTIFSVVAFT